jgi:hypothetical protein
MMVLLPLLLKPSLEPDDERSASTVRLVRRVNCVPEVDDQVAIRLCLPKTGKMDHDGHDGRLIDKSNSHGNATSSQTPRRGQTAGWVPMAGRGG